MRRGISCNIAKPNCLRNGMTSKLVEACQSSRSSMGRQSKASTNDTEHQANLQHDEGLRRGWRDLGAKTPPVQVVVQESRKAEIEM
jgi:hypothetical protein